jgi:hypothetical protein
MFVEELFDDRDGWVLAFEQEGPDVSRGGIDDE